MSYITRYHRLLSPTASTYTTRSTKLLRCCVTSNQSDTTNSNAVRHLSSSSCPPTSSPLRTSLLQLRSPSSIVTTSIRWLHQIHIENTPNPNAKMFLSDGLTLLPKDAPYSVSFDNNTNPNGPKSPLADALLKVEGVYSVLLSRDHITVVKKRHADWKVLDNFITSILQECIRNGISSYVEETAEPVQTTTPSETDEFDADLQEIIDSIQVLLNTRARPIIQEDGGDIEFIRFDADEGIVWIYMKGSCDGCPSSAGTLQNGILSMLQFFVPEVKAVRQCDENGEPIIEYEE